MIKNISRLFVLIILISPSFIFAQSNISGFIKDTISGEVLIGALIYTPDKMCFTTSNEFGYYSIHIKSQKTESIKLFCSYTGYKKDSIIIDINQTKLHNFYLRTSNVLNEVIIKSDKTFQEKNNIGKVEIPIEVMKKLPSIIGEKDILRIYQLMPGIKGGTEGSSGIYVRGGSPDQNLFLLDGMPLYNANHLGGFVSVFDINSINNVDLYKAGFPARYGGRLSSVMDIRLKEGNKDKYHYSYTISPIASKFSFEGPFKNKRTTYIITARRSFLDVFTRLFSLLQSDFKQSGGYYFTDLSAKVSHTFSDKDKLFVSIYGGLDKIGINIREKEIDNTNAEQTYKYTSSIKWGNALANIRWNHVYNSKLFSNLALGYSQFFYSNKLKAKNIDNNADEYSQSFTSNLKDISVKNDYLFTYNNNHKIRFGAEVTFHQFNPGIRKVSGNTSDDQPPASSSKSNSLDPRAYIEDDITLNKYLGFNIGAHYNSFITNNKAFHSIQPRIVANYKIFPKFSIKGSYSRMQQNLHLLSNNNAGLPTDLWVQATKNAPPEISDQYAVALNKYIQKYDIEITTEVYYKSLKNLIEFKDGSSFFSGDVNWENKIETNGTGTIKGAELLIQKKQGKINGWIGYAYSKNMRQFANLNNGKSFPYKFDRTHDISLVVNYNLNKKLSLSLIWVYTTGNAMTMPKYKYYVDYDNGYNGTDEIHVYGERNGYRIPDYHRLDIGLTYKKDKPKGTAEWNVGIYNIYNRHNPYFLYFKRSGNAINLYKFSLFPIIPSFSYTYSF